MKNFFRSFVEQLRQTPARNRRRRTFAAPIAAQVELLEKRVLLTSWSANITADTHWTAANGPYVLQNDITISNGATLTIDQGVQVQAINSSITLHVAGGKLNAVASTVGGITFSTNVDVKNGGQLALSDARVNGTLQLEANSASNIQTLSGNSFAQNAVTVDPNLVPLLVGNTFDPGSTVYLYGGTITSAVTWQAMTNVTQYKFINSYQASVQINSGGVLTIAAGNTISNTNSNAIVVNSNGKLSATSTAGAVTDFAVAVLVNNNGKLVSSGNRYDVTLQLTANSASNIQTLNGNSFAQNAVTVDPNLVPLLAGNLFDAGSTVYLYGGTITSAVTWQAMTNVTQYKFINSYQASVQINSGGVLTIAAGNTISNTNSNAIVVNSNGKLSATSTAGAVTDFVVTVLVNNGGKLVSSGNRYDGALQLTANTAANIQTLSGNSFAPDAVTVDPNLVPLLAGNTFYAASTVYLYGGTISTAVTWQAMTNVTQYKFINSYQASVQINSGGILTIAAGNKISDANNNAIVVNSNGQLSATSTAVAVTDFALTVLVNNGGKLVSSGNRFDGALQLTANSASNIQTLSGNSFAPGAVTVDPNLVPLLAGNTFDAGSTVYLYAGAITSAVTWQAMTNVTQYKFINSYQASVQINSGGVLTIAAGNTISNTNNNSIVVNSNGVINAVGVSFFVSTTFGATSGGSIRENVIADGTTMTIDSSSSVLFRDNTFLGLGSSTVVGAGNNTKTIDLTGNYWGTTDIPTIESRIQDKSDNAALPQINIGSPVALSTLSGSVWQDANANGLNDIGESGLSGVTVKLFDAGADGAIGGGDDVQFGSNQITDSSGHYAFSGLLPSHSYYVQVVSPANFGFTTPDQGDDFIDSDVDANGYSTVTGSWAGGFDPTWDAGVVKHNAVIGTPTVANVTEGANVDGSGNLKATGSISITDPDAGQASFKTTVTSASGDLGSLVLASNGTYTYTVANSAVQYLGAAQTKVDTFTVTSFDGTTKNETFTIHGVDGSVILTGTTLNVTGASTADTITFSEGTQLIVTLNGASFSYSPAQVAAVNISGNSGDDTVTISSLASGTAMKVYGQDGNDKITVNSGVTQGVTLDGGNGDDVLTGGSGNDTLIGGAGTDTLIGGAGNDTYTFDTDLALGSDTINEAGGGTDTLDFSATTTLAVSVNLSNAAAQIVNANLTLILSSGTTIENVIGGTLGDTLTGNTQANILTGGGGNDTLAGGAGNDTYLFDTDLALGSDTINESGGGIDTLDFSATTGKAVAIDLSNAAAQVVNAGLTLTLSAGNTVENVIGGSLNDTLTGNSLNNTLTGGAGNDTYKFDTDLALGSDTINESGGGIDTLDFSATTGKAVAIDLSNAAAQVVNAGLTLTLSAGNTVENVIGGTLNDTLTGNSLNNTLTGGAGNDTYKFDTDLALGSDTINESGGGVDTLDFSATTTRAVAIDLSNAAAQVVNAGLTLTLSSATTVENVIGGSLNDTLTGNSLNNTLTGGAGNDTYKFDTDLALGSDTINESGGGVDTLDFSATTTRAVAVNLSTAAAQVVNAGLTLTLSSATTVENVIGGSLNDTLTGNSLNNTLTGGAGNDNYKFDTDLALGSDTINESGGGVDTLDFSATTTRAVAIDLSNAAAQVVNAGLTLTLSAGNTVENVIGGTLNDKLTGNSLNNTLTGGAGNDTYKFDTDLALGSDTINESGGGIDTLDFSATTTRAVTVNLSTAVAQVVNAGLTLTLSSATTVENVIGGVLSNILIGNTLNNTLTGNAGNDVLTGGAGNDTLIGGAGKNILIGGDGADTLTGGSSEDLMIGARYTLEGNSTALTALQKEWTSASTFAVRMSHLLGTVAGGLNGTTVLKSTTVKEDAAKDTMTGGAGEDWYLRNNSGATVANRDSVPADVDAVFTEISTWL